MPISCNINIDKVDKKRFFEGKKGRYLDLVLYETPDSDYGDYLVKQRGDKGERMPILGNGKFFAQKAKGGKSERSTENTDTNSGNDPW